MFLFCFAYGHQNHKASRSTEVCWTSILEVLSHRVRMKYMRAWIIYIALHYIAPWHANVRNWIVSTIFSPVHRLNIVLGAAVYYLIQYQKWPSGKLTVKVKRVIPTTFRSQTRVGPCWAKELWLPCKGVCLTKIDVKQTSRFTSFFLAPYPCLPKAAANKLDKLLHGLFCCTATSRSFKSLSNCIPAHMRAQGRKTNSRAEIFKKKMWEGEQKRFHIFAVAGFSDLISSDSWHFLLLFPALSVTIIYSSLTGVFPACRESWL